MFSILLAYTRTTPRLPKKKKKIVVVPHRISNTLQQENFQPNIYIFYYLYGKLREIIIRNQTGKAHAF